MKSLIKPIKQFVQRLIIRMHEHMHLGVHYLYYPSNSNTLLVVFSAFHETPDGKAYVKLYNYMQSLKKSKHARLHILDEYGWGGAYYLLNQGQRDPEHKTEEIIKLIMKKHHHSRLITLGTSKGGSAAIYFGIKLNAEEVISGACQYYIGSYLISQDNMQCLIQMLGENYTDDDVKQLDSMLPNMIRKNKGQKTKITKIYSKNEHTYPEHIVHMLKDLRDNGFEVEEHEMGFTSHSEVGKHFARYLADRIKTKQL